MTDDSKLHRGRVKDHLYSATNYEDDDYLGSTILEPIISEPEPRRAASSVEISVLLMACGIALMLFAAGFILMERGGP